MFGDNYLSTLATITFPHRQPGDNYHSPSDTGGSPLRGGSAERREPERSEGDRSGGEPPRSHAHPASGVGRGLHRLADSAR